jgi:hypothetical protein
MGRPSGCMLIVPAFGCRSAATIHAVRIADAEDDTIADPPWSLWRVGASFYAALRAMAAAMCSSRADVDVVTG